MILSVSTESVRARIASLGDCLTAAYYHLTLASFENVVFLAIFAFRDDVDACAVALQLHRVDDCLQRLLMQMLGQEGLLEAVE